mgnify:CR=1 FL=1
MGNKTMGGRPASRRSRRFSPPVRCGRVAVWEEVKGLLEAPKSADKMLKAGDTILLQDGDYLLGGATLQVAARKAAPLTVAQIIENQLAGRHVAHRRTVGRTALGLVHRPGHTSHAQTEADVERRQPGGVPGDQIIVGGEHMHRNAGQRPHCRRQRSGQSLAFAGRHLGETVVEHHQRGIDLSVVGFEGEAATGRFDGRRKRFDDGFPNHPVAPETPLNATQTMPEGRFVQPAPIDRRRAHLRQPPPIWRPLPGPARPRRLPALRVGAPHQARQGRADIEAMDHVAGLK